MADVSHLSDAAKIAEAMRRSLPHIPAEARAEVEQLLTPANLGIMAATLAAWAGSHFFGVGEFVDLILLAVGVVTIGMGVFAGARELYAFVTGAVAATTDADLDDAGRHFARAVDILGVTVVTAVLTKGAGKRAIARGRPRYRGRPNVGAPPPPGVKPRISRPLTLPDGTLGQTDAWGNIWVSRAQTLSEQRITLYHEWVHSVLSPRLGPLRTLRAQLRMSGYLRSAFLRAIEEALAESYGQLKVNGIWAAIKAIDFPLRGPNAYVTVTQLTAEGHAIGTVVVGGTTFRVILHFGDRGAAE